MKLKFWPYARITFIFSWLKYEEILKTLESQVGWLLPKMALKSGYEMKIFILWYESTGKTGKKTVDRFLISFLVPEISAFKDV